MNLINKTTTFLVVSILVFVAPAFSQCWSLQSVAQHTQNFDTLENSGTSSILPAGWALSEMGLNANSLYTSGTGSSNLGDTYSYGSASATDRALGGLQSGSLTPTIGACFSNHTGSVIHALAISYIGEQWRLGATGRADRLDFQYSLDAMSLTSGTWIDADALDFSTPNSSGPTGAVDGNAAANRTGISSSITGLSIANGDTFWIRWSDFNASGADDGLAIDSFSITPVTAQTLPTLSVTDLTANEGGPGVTNFDFAVRLSSPAGPGGVTFAIATADGTATAGSDYAQNSIQGITIPSGQTAYTFTVQVSGDAEIEANETFFVNVTNITGATAGITQAQGTIVNDDFDTTPPTVSYTPLPNIESVSDRTFEVTAADNVGVTSVVVVWANNGGLGGSLSSPCTIVSGTTWSCTIVAAAGVPPQTGPGTVSYYISTDDAAGNSSTNPAGGTPAGGTRNLFTVGSGGTIDVSVVDTFENVVLGDGWTLGGNATVIGALALNGILNTGAGKITLGCKGSVSAAGASSYVVGTLEKVFCVPGSFTYPVGTTPDGALAGIPSSEYSPFTADVTAGDAGSSLTVTAVDGVMAGSDPLESASRYWNVTETGNLTADISFTYLNSDAAGDESGFDVLRRSGTVTEVVFGGTVNPANNTATATGVTNFSSWAAGNLAPTAANASVEGRVATASGQGIRNAAVVISGGGLAEPRTVRTGQFGVYRFGDLPVGHTYIVSVVSDRFRFPVPARVLALEENVTGFDFEADPR